MDSALVLDPKATGEEWGEVLVTHHTGSAAHHPKGEGSHRGDHHVDRGPNRDTSSQGDVLDVSHRDLAPLVEHGGEGEGSERGGAQPDEGVKDGPVLVVPFEGQRRVEGGPEHPEKQSPHHRQNVGLVTGDFFCMAIIQRGAVQHKRDPQAEVTGEEVDEDGAAGVIDLQILEHGPLGDGKNWDFKDGHHQELHWTCLPQDGAKGDQHNGASEFGIKKVYHA